MPKADRNIRLLTFRVKTRATVGKFNIVTSLFFISSGADQLSTKVEVKWNPVFIRHYYLP
jgi:hypothetical protein